MSKIAEKFNNIEFLRVFLTLAIVLFHNRIHLSYLNIDFYNILYQAFNNGRNAVEGFFIISGFLLAFFFKKKTSLLDFIKKKYIRLSPVIAFSVVLCGISWALGVIKFKLLPNLLTIFLLNSFGKYWCIGSNVVLWYTSALFFGLLVYFCIYKFVKEKFVWYVVTFQTFISLLLLQILNKGNYGGYEIVYYNFISVSTLRAFAGLGLGAICSQIYIYLTEHNKINNNYSYIASFIELVSFGFIFYWLFLPHYSINHFFFAIAFVILFLCFLFKNGILSKLFDGKIWPFLGKYTYSIFVIHYIIIKILYDKLWKPNIDFVSSHVLIPMIINLLTVILFGVLTYHLIEKPAIEYFGHKKEKL